MGSAKETTRENTMPAMLAAGIVINVITTLSAYPALCCSSYPSATDSGGSAFPMRAVFPLGIPESYHFPPSLSKETQKDPPIRKMDRQALCFGEIGEISLMFERSLNACIWMRSAAAAWHGRGRSLSDSTRAYSACAASALRRGCGRPRRGSCRCPRAARRCPPAKARR